MPSDVSRNMPAAGLDDDEREKFDIWRRSREVIARCIADMEGYPDYALADDVLLALMTADLMIVKKGAGGQ
jgi:hypothetical protein